MIQTNDDVKFNMAIIVKLGIETKEKAMKVYMEAKAIWDSSEFPVDFEGVIESSVRTTLAMNLLDGMPLALALQGMCGNAMVMGYQLAQMQQSKDRVLN